jgi:5-methylthioribose kinase
MKILAIEKENEITDWTREKETLEQEASHVYKAYLSGFVREIYFNEHKNAVLILECDSIEKARELLDGFPLVSKKLVSFELMQLAPYSGYLRLI